jgi:uncharacterized protein YfdQ (DUF2303 family)
MSNGTRMNQVEFLLRLSDNARDKGDELTRNQNSIYTAHARDLVELSRMIEMAKANIDVELERFSRWVTRENESSIYAKPKELPRVVTGAGNEVKARG